MFYLVSYFVLPSHFVLERRFNDIDGAKEFARRVYFDNPRAVSVRVSQYRERSGVSPMVVNSDIEFRF